MIPNLTVLTGDALEMLRTLPSASVQCCVTSPPYWGLRDYGVVGMIGLEPTFAEWLARLRAVFAEVHACSGPTARAGSTWAIATPAVAAVEIRQLIAPHYRAD